MRTSFRLPVALTCLLALFAGFLLVGGPAGAAPQGGVVAAAKPAGYRPVEGGHFNNPYARAPAQNRIEDTILGAIRKARKDSRIRITAFSLDRVHVAEALVAAKRRGVRVQILLNDHQFTPAMRVLRDGGFKADIDRRSFMKQCDKGCRGGGYLHTKMYLFSHTGRARKVVMVGSANLTTNAVAHQWNDLYVQNDVRELYRAYNKVFLQMARDRQARPTYLKFAIKRKWTLFVMPPPRPDRAHDPVIKILDNVRCRGAGTPSGRTQIRISQHRMSDRRGGWIARKVVDLWARGCDIRVMHGSADKHVRPEMNRGTPRGLVPARSNGFDRDGDTFLDIYSHQKYMTIRGHYGKNKDAWITMTGSSNWASLGVHGDENILLVRGERVLKQWRRNFDFIWDNYSKPVVYRPARGVRGGAALRAAIANEPKPGGRYWEGD